MSQVNADRVDAAVSYARHDQARVEPILSALRARGLTVWFDKDIPGGALWEEIIARKYRASGALLFFVSRASLSSQRCSEEVSTARTLGKPIIPVLLDPLTLPDDLPDRFVLTLQARNTVDVVELDASAAEAAILRALDGFGIAPGAPPPAQAPVPSRPRTPARPQAARQPQAPLPSRGGAARWFAFGGATVAIVVVAGAAYFLTLDRPAPSTRVESSADPTNRATAPEPTRTADTSGSQAQPVAGQPAARPPVAVPEGSPTVQVVSTDLRVGKPITLRVAGLPGDKRDYVAIARADAPPGETVSVVYSDGAIERDVTLKPVPQPGAYEIRVFYGADSAASDAGRVRLAVPLTVAEAAPVEIRLAQPSFVEGRPIRLGYTGMPGNTRDWIALSPSDAAPGTYTLYLYTDGHTDGSMSFRPLMKPGRYEARAYFDDSTGDKTIRAQVVFDVTPAPPLTASLDKTDYAPNAEIIVTFDGMPGNERDWFSIAKAGSADTGYLTYDYTRTATAGTVKLEAPEAPGDYEVRAYFDDSTGDKTVRARMPFKVVAP